MDPSVFLYLLFCLHLLLIVCVFVIQFTYRQFLISFIILFDLVYQDSKSFQSHAILFHRPCLIEFFLSFFLFLNYLQVPGGVGPMTIAMLLRNTINGTIRSAIEAQAAAATAATAAAASK